MPEFPATVARDARVMKRFTALCAAGLALAASALAAPPEHVALVGGKIIPVVGEPIEKGTVLIHRGKIAKVGKDVEVPYDARVFDVTGKVVFPGMIDPHSSRGTDVSNEARPVTPHLDTGDAIDPSQLYFEDSLRTGITAINVCPGDNTAIGGLGRLVRPIGLTPAEMTIAEGQVLKLSVSPRGGWDRMLQLSTLRETMAELDDYLDKLAEKRYEDKLKEDGKTIDVGPAEARKRGRDLIRAEDIDDEHRNLLRLRGGQVRVLGQPGPTLFKGIGAIIACNQAMDVAAAVKFAKDGEFFDRAVLSIGSDCFKAVKELKAAARPIILSGDPLHRETDPMTGRIQETFVPKKLSDAGLLYALTPGPDGSLPERMLNYQAARCVREGISRDEALRLITLNPAKILGVADRLGSIEPGKDASLLVFSGDPLDFNSVVERVFIDGIPAYDRAKDVRWQRLLEPAIPTSRPASQESSTRPTGSEAKE